MTPNKHLFIRGIPTDTPDDVAAIFRTRIFKAITELIREAKVENVEITISNTPKGNSTNQISKNTKEPTNEEINGQLPIESRSEQYVPSKPFFTFEQLIVDDKVREELLAGVELIRLENRVFDEWGLRKIEPFPRTALNFYGKPGTGKTLAAHAIANTLGKEIIVASYAQIESKYLGDAPKNVEAIFHAAEQKQAVLFIDEADSLLSKRLTGASQGSERAANSLTSQLLICLEKFRGVVIFATNLVDNYDKAFETRVRHIHFPMPNKKARQEIWRNHLPPELPLKQDVSIEELAKIEDVCGRDIKNAVIDAAVRVARSNKNLLELKDLIEAIERVKYSRITSQESNSQELTPEEKAKVREKLIASSELNGDSQNLDIET